MLHWFFVLTAALLYLVGVSAAQVSNSAPARPSQTRTQITFSITDENNVAVAAAVVTIGTAGTSAVVHCDTDYAGRCSFRGLPPGTYTAQVSKASFYRLTVPSVQVGATETVDVTLHHEQEIHESVDVVASPPTIDPEHTARTETLTTSDILNVPYPTSRDIRQALPLLPSVVRDMSGNIHVAGSTVSQTLNILDGLNTGAPSATFSPVHISTDAVRTIDVETSRYSAEYGKGTSILGMQTGTGDDRYRFSATNFVPSFQFKRGINFNQWVPRAVISGPIVKGRAWFFDSPDAEYNQDIFPELPKGADRSSFWRLSNLGKVQVNLTPSNTLSGELLVNGFHSRHEGLSQFTPIEATTNARETTWIAAIRDQHYFGSGLLLETAFAADQFENSSTPLGNLLYTLKPGEITGSYFERAFGNSRRLQGITNVYVPPRKWLGRHDVKFGVDVNRLTYSRLFVRSRFVTLRTDGTLAREGKFDGLPLVTIGNVEASGYLQDRWTPTERLLIESGLRFDWDKIVRDPLLSPRVALTYMIGRKGETKISGGVGLFYLATNLDLVGRPQSGTRLDTLFASDGTTPIGPAQETRFIVNRDVLKEPRFVNWSIAFEHRLPRRIYARVDVTQRLGYDGFAFINRNPAAAVGEFDLRNSREDRYHALTVSGRHSFKDKYPFFFAYTRSSARSNQVFDFNLSSPVIGTQQGGPFPWDTPNRIVSWGWAPFVWSSTLGYAVDWHSGFPYSAVNFLQEITGAANSYRLPRYFNLTLSAERRFHLAGYFLALRASVENITGRENPTAVENNIDAPQFRSASGVGHRAVSARIRFLGRSKGKQSDQKPNTRQDGTNGDQH